MPIPSRRLRLWLGAGATALLILLASTTGLAQTSSSDSAASASQNLSAAPDPGAAANTGTTNPLTHGAGLGSDSALPADGSASTGNFGPDPIPAHTQGSWHDTDKSPSSDQGGNGMHARGMHSGDRAGGMGFDRASGPRFGSAFSSGMAGGHGHGGMSGMTGGGGEGGGGQQPLNLDSLFQIASRASQNLSRDLGTEKGTPLNTALGILPKLDQIERSGLRLPVSSSTGNFQFNYHDSLQQAVSGKGGYGKAQASFNSAGFKNDLLHFSATTSYGLPGASGGSGLFGSGTGSHGGGMDFGGSQAAGGDDSMAGSMSGAEGAGAAGGGMHSGNGGGRHGQTGPAVSLKLSF